VRWVVWLGGFVQGDLLAGEVLELVDEVADVALMSGLAVVEAGPLVGVAGRGVGEQVVGDGEDGVAGGDDRAFFAAAAGEAPVALGEEGVGAGGADDNLAESAANPGVALAGGATLLLAGGAVLDRGRTWPTTLGRVSWILSLVGCRSLCCDYPS
jgi:hypothetical protein